LGDISDKPLVINTLTRHAIDAIMHFAGFAYVGESMTNPALYFHNNTCNSITLLQAACEVGIDKFIFSSTCATYGEPVHLPISEAHPLVPVNPYGESKLMTEKALRWFGDIHGLRWVCLRYFNAAGADPDLETGEMHDPETHLIPLVVNAASRQGLPIILFGDDYATYDGTAVRDFIHVSDLAAAHVSALEYLNSSKPNNTFNLGTGRGHSVRQVLQAVRDIVGRLPVVEVHPRRAGDPAILVADNRLAVTELGWQPVQSGLDNMVMTSWRWQQRLQQRSVRRLAATT
jgi:UDP-glucose 4-epimerase